jgi:glyoxylase-like metal-dependent hydrolase (beta-lactamase superfamily II)
MNNSANNFYGGRDMKRGDISFSVILILCFCLFQNCDKKDSVSWDVPLIDNFTVTQLSSDIYVIEENSEQRVNIVLFLGSEGNLLIDSGYDEDKELLNDEISQIDGRQILYIINSHYHDDHLGGNSIINSNGSIIGHNLGLNDFQNSSPGTQIIGITEDYQLNFKEEIRCIIPQENGHTKTDIMVYFPVNNVLCLGDMYLSQSFPSVNSSENASVQNMISNLNYINSEFNDDVTIVPGHGRPTSKEEFQIYIQMVEETVNIVKTNMTNGLSLSQMLEDDILKDYSSWGNYLPGLTKITWISSIYTSYYYEIN